jgi:hypothetical protein
VEEIIGRSVQCDAALCHNYYGRTPLDRDQAITFAGKIAPHAIGMMISSHSRTSRDVRYAAFRRAREAVNGYPELDLARITSPCARRPAAGQRREFRLHESLGHDSLAGVHAKRRSRTFKRVFQLVSGMWDRATGLQALYRIALLPIMTILAGLSVGLVASPWSTMATMKHFLSLPSCAVAHSLGLAPALRGDPGYWSWHDRDGDGIACEPFEDNHDDSPTRRVPSHRLT